MDDLYCDLKPILDWIPFIVFIGLLVFFMRNGPFKRQAEYFEFLRRYHTENLEETKKLNVSLARIADALEKNEK